MRNSIVSGWLLVAILVGVTVPMLAPATAHACSCMAPPPPEQILADAPVAFVGTQVGRTAQAGDANSVVLTVSVSDVYAGEVGPVVEIVTASDSAACGVDFAGMGPVGLYPTTRGAGFEVSSCDGAMSGEMMAATFETLGVDAGAPSSVTTSDPPAEAPATTIAPTTTTISPNAASTDTAPSSLIWLVAVVAALGVAAVGFLTALRRRR